TCDRGEGHQRPSRAPLGGGRRRQEMGLQADAPRREADEAARRSDFYFQPTPMNLANLALFALFASALSNFGNIGPDSLCRFHRVEFFCLPANQNLYSVSMWATSISQG